MKTRTQKLARTAMFAAVAAVLMFLEFPLPFVPPFLKFDFSDVAVLVCALTLGPLPGLAAAFIKDVVHLSLTSSGGVGELADFLISGLFCVAASLVYRTKRSTATALGGCAAGVAAMTVAAVVLNKFLLLPFYSKMMPLDAIFSLCAKVNPFIVSVNTYLLYAVTPFNLFKGITVSVLALIVSRRLEHYFSSIRTA